MKKISFFGWLFLIGNLFCAAALVITYFTNLLDPEKYWFFAFFGLAYPALLISNVLFCIYWLIRKKIFFFLSFLVLLFGLKTHKNVFKINFNKKEISQEKNENDIRVMTYNVNNFRAFDQQFDPEVRSNMLAIIKNQQPDIICFQEFYTRRKGSYDLMDSIKYLLGSREVYFDKILDTEFQQIGMAIFSKYKIIKTGYVKFSNEKRQNSCIYADLKIKKDTIRVFGVHLQSINFKPEDYEYIKDMKNEFDPDVVSSKKIGSRLKLAFKKRAFQAKLVAKAISESPYPVILCGDFNDTPVSFTFKTISENLKSAFSEKGSGYEITYAGAFPNFQIDYIMAGKEFEIQNYQVIKKELSDHYPIRSDLSLVSNNLPSN